LSLFSLACHTPCMRKIILISVSFLLSCSSAQQRMNERNKKTVTSGNSGATSVRSSVVANRNQEQQDRARILAKKQDYVKSGQTQTQAALPVFARPQSANQNLTTPAPLFAKGNESESVLYQDVTVHYQSNDLFGFQNRARSYLKRFPTAEHRDDVLYMVGVMALAEHHYGEALANLSRILQDHPEGRKAPAALFAKGIVLQRMNLKGESKQALNSVLTKFPGSPESMRAQAELKMMR